MFERLIQGLQNTFSGVKNEVSEMSAQRGGQVGVIQFIAVGAVGVIITLVVFAGVLDATSFSQNANFLTIRNTLIPVVAIAIVGGGAILAIITALGGGRR